MGKKIAEVLPSPAMEKYTPTIFVDLTKSDVDELKGVKVGDRVRVVITGKVKSITTREDNREKTGSIQLESKDVAIRDAKGGEFEKLLEDDD